MHQWCAHFAEVIVKAHLNHILKSEQKEGSRSDGGGAGVDRKGGLETAMREGMVARAGFIDKYGCSSPFLPWSTEYTPPDRGGDEDKDGGTIFSGEKLDTAESPTPQLSPFILPGSKLSLDAQSGLHLLKSADPSTYVSEEAAWELIPTTDLLRNRIFPKATPLELQLSDLMAAMAIRSLAETGAPSWPSVGTAVEDWPKTLDDAEKELKGKYGLMFPQDTVDKACEYARLGLLRAAYYTIMMRAAGSVGPGIEEDMVPTTALAYMA